MKDAAHAKAIGDIKTSAARTEAELEVRWGGPFGCSVGVFRWIDPLGWFVGLIRCLYSTYFTTTRTLTRRTVSTSPSPSPSAPRPLALAPSPCLALSPRPRLLASAPSPCVQLCKARLEAATKDAARAGEELSRAEGVASTAYGKLEASLRSAREEVAAARSEHSAKMEAMRRECEEEKERALVAERGRVTEAAQAHAATQVSEVQARANTKIHELQQVSGWVLF